LNAATPADPENAPVYLILGSNIDPETNLPQAIKILNQVLGVAAQSSIWRTPAVGFEGEDFLNAVVLIYTCISANTLKNEVLRPLEALLGRVRSEEKFSPRAIDIDILLYQDEQQLLLKQLVEDFASEVKKLGAELRAADFKDI